MPFERSSGLTMDDAISDWATEYPEAIPVFEMLKLDYCCGGRSLEFVCLREGLDPCSVMAMIHRVDER